MVTERNGLSRAQRVLVKAAAEDAGRAAAKETLTALGVDVDNPLEMQADFGWVRKSRVGSEDLRKWAKRSAMGIAVTAIAYGLWELAKAWWQAKLPPS